VGADREPDAELQTLPPWRGLVRPSMPCGAHDARCGAPDRLAPVIRVKKCLQKDNGC